MRCIFRVNRVFFAVGLALAAATTSPALAEAIAGQEVKRQLRMREPLADDLREKSLFVEFHGSPKMSLLVGERLRKMGYTVADREEGAGVKLRLRGVFRVDGAGKSPVGGKVGEFLEQVVKLDAPASPDYQNQTVGLHQIVVAGVGMGAFSVSDMATWVAQQLGIAGRLNEMITGDPRGWCMHENCNKFRNWVILSAHGPGTWFVDEETRNEKVVIDQLIADALDLVLEPFAQKSPNGAKGNAVSQ